jgi:hypothetical protein
MAKRSDVVSLRTLHHALLKKQQHGRRKGLQYGIPSLWLKDSGSREVAAVEPFQFWMRLLIRFGDRRQQEESGQGMR